MSQISGQVFDEDGNPIDGAQITARGPKDGGSAMSGPGPKGEKGYYTIPSLKGEGSYSLTASHPQYGQSQQPPPSYPAPSQSANLSLWGPGPFISGHVRDNTGKPLEKAYVMAAPDWAPDSAPPQSAWSDIRGYYQINKVKAGVRYGMSARKEGYISRDEEVRYAQAGDRNVELVLHRRTAEDPPEQPLSTAHDPAKPFPQDPVVQAMMAAAGLPLPPKPPVPAIPSFPAGAGFPAARLGDQTQHGGMIGPVVAAMTVLIGNKPAATIGDLHVCPAVGPLPHVGGPVIPPGATKVMICNKPAARVTDKCTCTGPPDTIVMGEATTMIG